MTKHTSKRSRSKPFRPIRRFAWLLALALALTVGFATLRDALPEVDAASLANARSAINDPAQQAVWDYVFNRNGSRPAPTPLAFSDPAQHGVMSYVNAHARAQSQPSMHELWDQATQAVLDYLGAHSR